MERLSGRRTEIAWQTSRAQTGRENEPISIPSVHLDPERRAPARPAPGTIRKRILP